MENVDKRRFGAVEVARLKWRIAVAVNAALAVTAACCAVYLGYRVYWRTDMTGSGAFSVSDTTVRRIKSLDKPLRVTVFYGKDYPPHQWSWQKIHDLLEEFKLHSDRIEVVYVDPHRKPVEAQQLRQKYSISESDFNDGAVVFEYGDKARYVSDSRIIERPDSQEPSGPGFDERRKFFRGEEAFLSVILSLVEERKPVALVLAGHGEAGLKEPSEPLGFYEAALRLTRDGFDVKELRFGPDVKSVPGDCDVLIVPGPQSPLPREEVEALAEYARKGGKLFVMPSLQFAPGDMIQPIDLNLKPLLDHFGITLGDRLIVEEPTSVVSPDTVQILPVTQYAPEHEATRALGSGEEKPSFFMSARSVFPDGKNSLAVALTSRTSVEKGDLSEILDQRRFENLIRARRSVFNPDKDKRGPFPIVCVGEVQGARTGEAARIVVAGTHNFAGNLALTRFLFNPDLFMNLVNWLTARESHMGISAKRANEVTYLVKPAVARKVFWLVLVVMPFTALFAGVAVWIARRK